MYFSNYNTIPNLALLELRRMQMAWICLMLKMWSRMLSMFSWSSSSLLESLLKPGVSMMLTSFSPKANV